MHVYANASTGSGVSLAGFGRKTLSRRSPTFLNLDTSFQLDTLPWLELAAGIMLELEGRVGIGLLPRLRAFFRGKARIHPYFTLGAPVFVYPYSLYGVMGGFGTTFNLTDKLQLIGESTVSAFVGGSDLADKSALAKIDFSLGFRVSF